MNIFSIGTPIVFTEKPNWLDEYKKKHNDIQYDYHVTLIQPRCISEKEMVQVKEKLDQFFKDSNKRSIPITFNEVVFDDSEVSENDGCVMILAKNKEVSELQKTLVELMKDWKDYYIPKTEEYENNFRPHLTIAQNLNKEKFDLAHTDLKGDCLVKAEITKVILTIVRDIDSSAKEQDFVFELHS